MVTDALTNLKRIVAQRGISGKEIKSEWPVKVAVTCFAASMVRKHRATVASARPARKGGPRKQLRRQRNPTARHIQCSCRRMGRRTACSLHCPGHCQPSLAAPDGYASKEPCRSHPRPRRCWRLSPIRRIVAVPAAVDLPDPSAIAGADSLGIGRCGCGQEHNHRQRQQHKQVAKTTHGAPLKAKKSVHRSSLSRKIAFTPGIIVFKPSIAS